MEKLLSPLPPGHQDGVREAKEDDARGGCRANFLVSTNFLVSIREGAWKGNFSTATSDPTQRMLTLYDHVMMESTKL